MKKIIPAVMLLLLAACESDFNLDDIVINYPDDNINWGSAGNYSPNLQATINDGSNSDTLLTYATINRVAVLNGQDFEYRIDAPGYRASLGLVLKNIRSTGQYRFGFGNSITCVYDGANYVNDPAAYTGSLIIDSLSAQYIRGTFSVVCQANTGSAISISEGKFSGSW